MASPAILADIIPRPSTANSAAAKTTTAPRNSKRKPSHLQNHKQVTFTKVEQQGMHQTIQQQQQQQQQNHLQPFVRITLVSRYQK